MLDANIEKLITIEAKVSDKAENTSKVLLLRASKMYICCSERIYSELEEQTFDVLNNNYGYGMLDIEFVFDHNVVSKSYPKFFTKCFVMRTDTNVCIKPMKSSNKPANSKINQNGDLVVGVRYYFQAEAELDKILKSNSLLIEGFIALEKPTNVYGVMCQLEKGKENWEITSAYTCKPQYARNIKHLID